MPGKETARFARKLPGPAGEAALRTDSSGGAAHHQIFVSYSSHDAFEAGLLQYAMETMLGGHRVRAWTYQRDQPRSEREIATAIKRRVQESAALVFLVSPVTLEGGAAQWVELAYADAFDVRIFVILHHLKYSDLKTAKESRVPPLLLASQCNEAGQWKEIIEDLRRLIGEREAHG